MGLGGLGALKGWRMPQPLAQSWLGHPPRQPPGSRTRCWPLGGWRGLGAASLPLWGLPWPPRAAFTAPAGSGGPGHSLPWLQLGLFLLRGDGNGSRGVAAGSPTNGSGRGAGELVRAGSGRAAGGGWAGGERPSSGGSGARGTRGAALPPPGSTGVLPAQQTAGLSAALLHSDTCTLLHECRRAVLEGDPQRPAWPLCVHPLVGQAGRDGVPPHGCLQPRVAKDVLQLPVDAGLQGLEERWLVPEKVQPVWGLEEAAHRTPGHPFCSPPLGCCRVMEVVGGWGSGSSSRLADDD